VQRFPEHSLFKNVFLRCRVEFRYLAGIAHFTATDKVRDLVRRQDRDHSTVAFPNRKPLLSRRQARMHHFPQKDQQRGY